MLIRCDLTPFTTSAIRVKFKVCGILVIFPSVNLIMLIVQSSLNSVQLLIGQSGYLFQISDVSLFIFKGVVRRCCYGFNLVG